MLKISPPMRGQDTHGSGAYRAPRGSRTHKGIDLACWPGSRVLSPVFGVCTKLGYPYGDDLSFRYVEVTTSDDHRHRFFYVEPTVAKGDVIVGDQIIGIVQTLAARYEGITPHFHYEILAPNGESTNPTKYWR